MFLQWYHRFQAFYLHAILAFYGLSMTYNPYYLFRMQHNDTIPNSTTALAKDGFLRQYRAYAVAMRLFFIFRTAVMPWYGQGGGGATGNSGPGLYTGKPLWKWVN